MPALKNPKQETFVQLVATGEKATAAYRIAFQTKAKSAQVSACQLLKLPKVALRVREIREKYKQHVEAQIENQFLTLDEKRRFLARVARTPIGEITAQSDLCQEHTVTSAENGTRTEKIKMPSKLDAIKMDLQIMGELAKDKKDNGRVDMQAIYLWISNQITYHPMKQVQGREVQEPPRIKRFGKLELCLDSGVESDI